MAEVGFSYYKRMRAYTTAPQPSIRRTPMSDGLSKQAKRYQRTLDQHSVEYLMTNAQYLAFRTWWENTVEFGALWFDFVDPITDATIDGRIVGGSYSSTPYTASQSYWVVSMAVETWR